MKRPFSTILRPATAGLSLLLLLIPGGLFAQDPAYPPPDAAPIDQGQLLSPVDLDNLVAPLALYPDPLLSQVLVAATYPAEVMDAAQWLQANRNLQGQALVDAARQQNWDPSVQALVAFPDVLGRLASDNQWLTNLGNAFLVQQSDVMGAVQRLRARAQSSGVLRSTPQQSVITDNQYGQPAIEIEPTDPNTMYVPSYNPAYVWGDPEYGYYPQLYYPEVAYGYGFYPGIYIGGFFGGIGWRSWGWYPNWYGHRIYTNAVFFNRFGYRGGSYGGGYNSGYRGGVWAHNPSHRLGVPYTSRGLATRYGGTYGGYSRGYTGGSGSRSFSGVNRAPNTNVQRYNGGGSYRQFGGSQGGSYTPNRSYSPSGSYTPNRSYSPSGSYAPNRSYSPSGSYTPNRSYTPNQSVTPNRSFNPAPAYRAPAQTYSPAPNYRSNPSFNGGNRSFEGGNRSFGGGNRSFSNPAPSNPAPRSFSVPRSSSPAPTRHDMSAPRSFSSPSSGGGFSGRSSSGGGGNFHSNGNGGGSRSNSNSGGGGSHGGGHNRH